MALPGQAGVASRVLAAAKGKGGQGDGELAVEAGRFCVGLPLSLVVTLKTLVTRGSSHTISRGLNGNKKIAARAARHHHGRGDLFLFTPSASSTES